MSNKEFNRSDLIKLVTDTYDKLSPDQRNSYQLGMELAKLKGTRTQTVSTRSLQSLVRISQIYVSRIILSIVNGIT